MKKEMKMISALLAAALTISMAAGCSGKKETEAPAASETAAEETAAETAEETDTEPEVIHIEEGDPNVNIIDMTSASAAVFYYDLSDTTAAAVRTALDARLDEVGVKYSDYDSGNDQDKQNEQIEEALDAGANVLMVNIVDAGSADASLAIIDKARAADVPVIFFGRAAAGEGEEEQVFGSYDKCAFAGIDQQTAGRELGGIIGEYILENFDAVDLNGDGNISYVMFIGESDCAGGTACAQYAVEAANAALAEEGKDGLAYLDPDDPDGCQLCADGAWSTEAAARMTEILEQHKEENGDMIELAVCGSDGMSEGVISALNDRGYNLGDDDSTMIPVYSVDSADAAVQLADDGKILATARQEADRAAAYLREIIYNAGSGAGVVLDGETGGAAGDAAYKTVIPYNIYTGEK